MADTLHFVYWHVNEHGQSAQFENDGSSAMKFAMNLERMGYRCKVIKESIGQQNTQETVYESDNWLSLHEHIKEMERGNTQDVQGHQ